MLSELLGVRQIKGEQPRRWFRSKNEDLIVWYTDDGSIYGFQYCYDRDKYERALTWTIQDGYSHNRVDDGESNGLAHKSTPILAPDGVFDHETISRQFFNVSGNLPRTLAVFVAAKLKEYHAHNRLA